MYPLTEERLKSIWNGTDKELVKSFSVLKGMEVFYQSIADVLPKGYEKEFEDIRISKVIVEKMLKERNLI